MRGQEAARRRALSLRAPPQDPGPGAEDQASGDGENEQGDDCALEFGPLPVTVTAAELAGGAVTSQFGVTVPSGDYEELSIVIAPISAQEAGTDATLQAMAGAGDSVKIDGTIDGAAFSYTTRVAFSQHREPFSIPAAGGNVTLVFDPTTWFVDASGNRLDPTVGSNAQLIDQKDLKRILVRSGHPAHSTKTIQYLVKGSGTLTVKYESLKGGSAQASVALQ